MTNLIDKKFYKWYLHPKFKIFMDAEQLTAELSKIMPFSRKVVGNFYSDYFVEWADREFTGLYTYKSDGDEHMYVFFFQNKRDLSLFELTWC